MLVSKEGIKIIRSSEMSVGVIVAYIEVTPFDRHGDEYEGDESPSFMNASIKSQLMQMSFRSGILHSSGVAGLYWHRSIIADTYPKETHQSSVFLHGILSCSNRLDEDHDDYDKLGGNMVGIQSCSVPLRQCNPAACPPLWPCRCVAYVIVGSNGVNKLNVPAACQAHITAATVVQLAPTSINRWKMRLTGEEPECDQNYVNNSESDVLMNHNATTISELTIHLRTLMTRKIWIGSTKDALRNRRCDMERKRALRYSTANTTGITHNMSNQTGNHRPASLFFAQGALIIHSPDRGAGKTCLVETILRKKLQCRRIHLIRPGPLLAKYGAYADSALSVIVHQAALAAAFRREPVALILDHLDAFLPNRGDIADASLPVLNGMVNYIRQLTRNLQHEQEILFPTGQVAYYNWLGTQGYALPVQFVLVAIVTCPDTALAGTSIMNAARYRLPSLTAETRFQALVTAFRKAGIIASTELKSQLPLLAASASWMRGGDFLRIATWLSKQEMPVTVNAFQTAIKKFRFGKDGLYSIQFLGSSDVTEHKNWFASVGGNQQAIVALEDAMAVNSEFRQRMMDVGIAPPCGVLLYGPPGTGKTMLARAIAKLLRTSTSESSLGGAFIALNSSAVVQSEVGTGEKIVINAFETAKSNAPAVVFIDEFQALFMERSASNGSTRLTTTLMVCMDDLKRWRELCENQQSEAKGQRNLVHRVVVLAATNTPWMVDKSFLRPGRFDRVVHVGLPNEDKRYSIWNLHLKKVRLKSNDDLSVLSSQLATLTEGFSGADIAAFARAAAVRCLIEGDREVEYKHFDAVWKDGLRGSSDATLVERISKWTCS